MFYDKREENKQWGFRFRLIAHKNRKIAALHYKDDLSKFPEHLKRPPVDFLDWHFTEQIPHVKT